MTETANTKTLDPKDPAMQPSTMFLIPPDDREQQIAKAYIARTYPGTLAHAGWKVDLAGLSRESKVIVLERRGVNGLEPSALEETYEDPHTGLLKHRRIKDLSKFIPEVREIALVRAADHFKSDAGAEHWSAKLDEHAFANDLMGKVQCNYWAADKRITRS